jgi:UDP-N-acetylmuramoylalanine--D-glutamate ligase
MNIAIVGYDKQGKSAFEYWNKPGNTITICDQNILHGTPEGVMTNFGGDYLQDLQNFDLIVRTPGLHPSQILEANPDHPEVMDKITTVTNEFFKVCPAPIIGVTGTKGKGTTSTLIAKILEAAGHKVHLGGNIGIPPLDMLKNNILPTDTVVLELANFQLIDLHYSPKVAVCLMVAPEHLDWHTDMYEYMQSKQQMFVHQTHDNLAVYNARNEYSEDIVGVSQAYKIAYDVPPIGEQPIETRGVYLDGDHIRAHGDVVCSIDDVMLLGHHNIENVCAAIAATWDLISKNKDAVKKAVKSFSGLPHRLEIIKQVEGVWYVDDSFGTTPETAIVALDAFKQPKVLIAGGSDKGANFEALAQKIVASNVRFVVCIGQTGPTIMKAIKKYDTQNKVGTVLLEPMSNMPAILDAAKQQAKKGDVVLLSTGCASFGAFKNYEDRGNQFKQVVAALAGAEK